MFRNMRLTTKMVISFLIIGIIPFGVLAWISLWKASSSLSEAEYNKLKALRDVKKRQITEYYYEKMNDVTAMADNPHTITVAKEMEKASEEARSRGVDGRQLLVDAKFMKVYNKYYPGFKDYMDIYGYHDLFIMCPEGHINFSIAQEMDFGTVVSVTGTHLGEAWRAAMDSGHAVIVDIRSYKIDDNKPAQFVAAPIVDGGQIIGVAALQISMDQVNSLMQERSGLGKTGETYLVGSDKLMRSDSYLDPINHSLEASLRNSIAGKVDTEASRAALNGITDEKIVIDYNDEPVLSAYAPLEIQGLKWAILAEIDESEAFAAVRSLQYVVGIIAIITIAAVISTSVMLARSIARPINRIIKNMTTGAEQVASASQQVSSVSQQMAEAASEQASSLEETSSSLEQMTAMTSRNADSANQASALAKEASAAAQDGNESMQHLNTAMGEISASGEDTARIVKTIEDIAFQTNLLALNAAVEAARAGEVGSGFAVVAEEVRNLAQRAGDAARNIGQLVEKSTTRIDNGLAIAEKTAKALEEITANTQKVSNLLGEIAAVNVEQAQGIDHVNVAVEQMDEVTQSNAANSEESASASEELFAQARQLNEMVVELLTVVGGSETNGKRHPSPESLAVAKQTVFTESGNGGNGSQARVHSVLRGNENNAFSPAKEATRQGNGVTANLAPTANPDEQTPQNNGDLRGF